MATVNLFSPAQVSLGSVGINPVTSTGFAEGGFAYAGAPVGRAVIDFNEAFVPVLPGVQRFAIDNVQYDPIPEPGTTALLAGGLIGLGWLGRRYRRR